jgi:O-antigen ligase
MSVQRVVGALRQAHGDASLATFGVATILVVAAAWTLVRMPVGVAVPAVLGGSVALTAWLLYPDSPAYALLALCPFTVAFDAGPLKDVYVQDLILGVLTIVVLSATLAGMQRQTRFRSRTAAIVILLWVVLFLWDCFTYRFGSGNRWLMSSEIKNAWYTYRQIARYMLPFPIVALYLRDPRPAGRVVDVILLSCGGMALYAVLVAPRTGYVAIGPFDTGNQLAGFLVPAVPFAAARLFMAEGRRSRLLAAAALLVMLRAIWLSGSRGGSVGCLATFFPMALFLPRRRIAAVLMGGAIALAVVACFEGNLLNSPKLRRYLTIGHFENVETFRWRTEQWEFFMQRLNASPITGVGTDVDRALIDLDRAQTPHNAYLAVAMRSGYVGLFLTVAFVLAAAALCVQRLLASGGHPEGRILWVGLLGAIVGLAVHGLGEATFLLAQVLFFFYTVLAFAVVEAAGSSSERDVGTPTAARSQVQHA